MTSDIDNIEMERVDDILSDWAKTHPYVNDWANRKKAMITRRIARRGVERMARRIYYDLYKYKVKVS